MQKDKLIKMLIGFLPLLLLFLDPPEGMDPKAWGLFPFYAGAILMVMLRPVGEATALAIFLGLYAVMILQVVKRSLKAQKRSRHFS